MTCHIEEVHLSIHGSLDKTLTGSVTIQMKDTGQYFPVVLFNTLYSGTTTFESADL